MIDRQFWRGKRVLLTGNTGFKGGWLSLWLSSMGAEVQGFALEPPTDPSLYEAARIGEKVGTTIGNICDFQAVLNQFRAQNPEIVFHLAAQSLVRRSYREPINTYMTNVMGTVHVLEAARQSDTVRVFVNVTSDKCYENREVPWGYRECDPMGGHDPYSSSKGCAELVAAAYRRSYFETSRAERRIALASVRAGNVIGGGDWAEDRLIPDCMRALMEGRTIVIRQPDAVRPWQHVMEPIAGYLQAAQRLWEDGSRYSGAYNFGPYEQDIQPVSFLLDRILTFWPGGSWETESGSRLHEANLLTLDSTLARTKLGWAPQLSVIEALRLTVEWFREYQSGRRMDQVTLGQIQNYMGISEGRHARAQAGDRP